MNVYSECKVDQEKSNKMGIWGMGATSIDIPTKDIQI